jgi:hypothetical protein
MKMIKITMHVLILCSVLFFLLSFVSIIKLVFTEDKIAKLPLTNYYFAKVEAEEQDFEVFRNYMEQNGWSRINQKDGSHTFEKDGNELEIIHTQIKTLIIDGNLNIRYINHLTEE